MPRDEARKGLFPSPDRAPAAIRRMASDELASRIWGEGAKAFPGADPPPADRSPEPRHPRGEEGPGAAGPPELSIAGQPARDRPRTSDHPVSAGRRRAEAALAALAREIRDLRGAIEVLSATVQGVRDDVRRELTKARRTTPRRGNGHRGEAEALSALQAELAELGKRIEGFGRPRAAPRLSKEVDALEERLEALENAARTTIPRAMTRAVDRRLERRLADLLGHIEVRLQEIVADPRPQPYDGAVRSLAPPASGAQRRRSSRRA